MQNLETVIAEQQTAVEELEKQVQLAYWDATISGSKDDEERVARLSAQLMTCYADPERYSALKSAPEPADHDLARQRTILIDSFASQQIAPDVIADLAAREMEIETLFSTFRASLRGASVTDNDLRQILQESNDVAERREVWESSKQIGAAVRDKLLELVALRNREAKRLGYPDFYIMQVRLQELDETTLFSMLDEISTKLTPYFEAYKSDLDNSLAQRFNISVADLRPWHYADPFFQEAPEPQEESLDKYFADKNLETITAQFFDAIGLNIHLLLAKSDLYEKPGKMQHAYCTAIGRATGDVRVLCNCRPNAQWMGTMLHEFGHAVYDDLIDPTLPFFLRTITHIMTTEAIAEMMGRFADNGSWLHRYADVPDEEAAQVERAGAQKHRAHMLIFTQWVQVMSHFERALYADPSQDLNKLWWDLVEKYQGLTRPEGRDAPDWAAKIHLATTPVYYHNYLLGEMTASQLLHTLRTKVVKSEAELVSSPAVGRWLTENIFRDGARYDWNETLRRATGESLTPAYLVAEMAQP